MTNAAKGRMGSNSEWAIGFHDRESILIRPREKTNLKLYKILKQFRIYVRLNLNWV